MDKESMHLRVDEMNHTSWHVRAIVHALIDLGRIERFECQYEDCILDSREFKPRAGARGHESYSLAIDHIDPRGEGGSNRPENLRIIHASCNVSRGIRKDSPETRARRRAARAEFLADDKRSAKWRAAMAARTARWNQKSSPDDRRGGRPGQRGGSLSLTPADIAEAKDLITKGWKMRDISARFGVSNSTMHNAVHARGAYRRTPSDGC